MPEKCDLCGRPDDGSGLRRLRDGSVCDTCYERGMEAHERPTDEEWEGSAGQAGYDEAMEGDADEQDD